MLISRTHAGSLACPLLVRAVLLIAATLYSACSGGENSAEHTVALDFGSVRVGQRATRSVTFGSAAFEQSLLLQAAPSDLTLPVRFELSSTQESTLEVSWAPSTAGRLDDAVFYRSDAGGRLFELRVHGRAEAPLGECTRAADCDDGDPCSEDMCEAGRCSQRPKAEGAACGERDCSVMPSCIGGRCVAVDISGHSDGLPCDDGDPCSADGTCREGLCYASEIPRPTQVRASLTTFGATTTASASDGQVFVLASAQRIDIVTLDDNGEMQLRARLDGPAIMGARMLDAGRFVLRSSEHTFHLLDARNPEQPVLTALSHVVPRLLPQDTYPVTPPGFADTGLWVVHKGMLVIPTQVQRVPGDLSYYLTVAPVDATLGLPHALDIPAYRMTLLADSVAYTEPYATERIGVFRLDAGGELESHTQTDASARGCGFPRYIAGHGDTFVTHADEDDVGYAEICLWRLAPGQMDGFEVLGRRLLKEHLHDQTVLLSQDHLYLGFGYRYRRGWLGTFLEEGKIVRYDRDWFTQDNADFSFGDGEAVSLWGNGTSTTLEHGYLVGLRGGPSALLNVEAGAVPVLGAGVGEYDTLLSVGSGRVLAAGASHAIVAEAQANSGQLELTWGPQLIHEARRAGSDLDVHVLHAGDHSITSSYAGAHLDTLYYHGYRVDHSGALHHESTKLAWSGNGNVAFARGMLWSPHGSPNTGVYTKLVGIDLAQPEAAPLEVALPAVAPFQTYAPRSLRATADGGGLVYGSPDLAFVIDLDSQSAAPFPLRGVPALPSASYYHTARNHERFAAEHGRIWLDAGGAVAIFDSQSHHQLASLTLPDAVVDKPVAIMWLEEDRAVVSYSAQDATSRLAQLVYREGNLNLLTSLSSTLPFTSAAQVEDGRFLLANADGLELVDLQCWSQGAGEDRP